MYYVAWEGRERTKWQREKSGQKVEKGKRERKIKMRARTEKGRSAVEHLSVGRSVGI